MLPLSTNIREAYKNGQEDEQNFIQNLALFLCTFLKEHAMLVEQKPELQNSLLEVSKVQLVSDSSRGAHSLYIQYSIHAVLHKLIVWLHIQWFQ